MIRSAQFQKALLWALAVALLAVGLAYLAHGTQRAWRLDNGIGKQARHLEFSLFA